MNHVTGSFSTAPLQGDIEIDVVIVGAGYAGLLAARDLARAGKRVVVLEARDRVGGRAWSIQWEDGGVADLGAGWIISPYHKTMEKLCEDYDIRTWYTYVDGMAIKLVDGQPKEEKMVFPTYDNPPANIASGLNALKDIGERAKGLDLQKPWEFKEQGGADKLDEIVFKNWINEHYDIDKESWAFVENYLGGYPGPPATYSALHGLFYARASHGFDQSYFNMEYWLRVDGGVQAPANHIAAELSTTEGSFGYLNTAVSRITQSKEGAIVSGAGYTVTCEKVIVAVPPPVALRIEMTQPDGTPLQGGSRSIQSRVILNGGIKAFWRFESPFWRDKDLSGYATGGTYAPLVWDGSPEDKSCGVLGMLGSAVSGKEPLVAMTPAKRKEILTKDLVNYFGSEADNPLDYAEHIWETDLLAIGTAGALTMGAWTSHGVWLRKPIHNIHFAGTERGTSAYNQMEGAANSGIAVAKQILGN